MTLKLKNISKLDYDNILNIVSDENVMKYIGNGQIWTSDKTRRFINYSLEDQKLKDDRTTFFYKIVSGSKFIGIIGIHKYDTEDNYYLTIFIDKIYQGKGYGRKSLELILDKFKTKIDYIYAQSLIQNKSSEIILRKTGFRFDKIIKRSGKKYKQFIYSMNYHTFLALEFPYLYLFTSVDTIIEEFHKLKSFKPKFFKLNNKDNLVSIKHNYKIDKEYVKITDYFTQECRLKCEFKKNMSALKYYSMNKGNVIHDSIIDNRLNLNRLDDTLYNKGLMCNNFPVTVAFSLYKYFKPTSVFDSSSGWGDRLIAAIAYGTSYTGVDPSNCLKPKYNAIINTLSGDKNKYKVIHDGIENVKINEGKYDMCLTSPPFFDLEVYENSKGQSISNFSTEEIWFTNFFIPLVEKNILALTKSGVFAIYIYLCDKCNHYLKSHPKLTFLGNFTFITPKKRNIMIFRKK